MQFKGLTEQEVQESRARYGRNTISEKHPLSFWEMLWENFNDPIIKILLLALLINVVFYFFGQSEWYESVGILIAVLLAAFISTMSEYKNDTAFQKLQEEASKIRNKTYRDGVVKEIPIDDLVQGDEVLLQTGDRVPADGYLLYGNVDTDQSQLNGESEEAHKIANPEQPFPENPKDLFDARLVFRGSSVGSGEAVMKITSVGDKTVYGSIAEGLSSGVERDTPLKVKLRKLAEQISIFGYAGGILVMLAYMAHALMGVEIPWGDYFSAPWSEVKVPIPETTEALKISLNFWSDILHAIMFAVIIIVMAVPEGLPLMIAIVTALNMGKMLKSNVLARKVSGIETAGSLNMLFSDKTGTITRGKPVVTGIWDGQLHEYKSLEELPEAYKKLTAEGLMLNNQAVFTTTSDKVVRATGGNITDRALLEAGISLKDHVFEEKVSRRIPFSSSKKFSGIILESGRCLIKGAPEMLLDRCRQACDASGNRVPCDTAPIKDLLNSLAEKAVRVLLLAETAERSPDGETIPDGDLVFTAVLGIRDDVRPEARDAIREVTAAGISVVMITGDRRETAVAIAKEAGLVTSDKDIVLTSGELSQMSDEDVIKALPNLKVISRALPEDKSRLVEAAKSLDLVAGMTGDGVNDSPALKKADVGFAMGSGTEVAKEASEIVILDDNFASIRSSILYGRTIFNSIRKFIVFQLTVNVAAVFISVFMPLTGHEVPLNIVQILWINLIMDTLAALALGGEPALDRYLKAKPRKRQGKLINGYMLSSILTAAIWICFLGILLLYVPSFADALGFSEKDLPTAFFTFFIFGTVFNAFNARTDGMNLGEHIAENRLFLIVMGLIAVTQVIMTQSGTFSETFGNIMHCHGLSISQWVVILLLSATVIPVDLCKKAIMKAKGVDPEI